MKDKLIEFGESRHKILLCLIAILFSMGVLLRLHGWSISQWHEVIDGPNSNKLEIVFGKPRPIRTDDWLLDLPMSMAQVSHRPPMPEVNRNIGGGEDMALPHHFPTLGILSLFRPFNLGFLINQDIGLSFLWWSLNFGMFYSFFLVFLIISKNRFVESALMGLCLLYSPYVQFWSFHKAQTAIFWAISFIFSCVILNSKKRFQIGLAGLGLTWGLGGMALSHIYPPISVSLGWLLPFAVLGFFLDRKKEILKNGDLSFRLGVFVLSLGGFAVTLGLFFWNHLETVQLLSNTTYPGRRFSMGGGYPGWTFFSHNFLAVLKNHDGAWLGNVCEASSFIYFFPCVVILAVGYFLQTKRLLNAWILPILGYLVFIGFYTYVGFPAWLAHLTLMGKSTPNRTQFGFGIANFILLSSAFSSSSALDRLSRGLKRGSLLIWMTLLAASGVLFVQHFPEFKYDSLILSLLLMATLSYLGFIGQRQKIFLTLLAGLSFLYTGWFNPWVRGGSDYLLHNPVSAKMIELDQAENGHSKWVTLGDPRLSNLPRILGIQSLGGYHGYPHFKMWDSFDPEHKQAERYNQAGFVSFNATADTRRPIGSSPSLDRGSNHHLDEIEVITDGQGVMEVQASPLASGFIKEGVDYFLVSGTETLRIFEKIPEFKKVFSQNQIAIFRRNLN